MQKRKILREIIKVGTSLLVAIAMISCFSLVYKHTPNHVSSKGETDYKWKPNAFMATMQEGFAFFMTDRNGYNNIATYDNNDILILGSSHMEAVQIPTRDNISSLLNNLLDYNTYSIGISSHNLYRCVSNYENAVKEYAPAKYTIIETSQIDLSKEEMESVIVGTDLPSKTYDTGMKKVIQLIPAAKPILNQLITWVTLKNPVNGTTTQLINTDELPEGYLEMLHRFLSIVSDVATNLEIKPIIFYHPSERLNPDGSVTYCTEHIYLEAFASSCADLGIIFIDMTDSFKSLYANEHQLAHGFINTAIGSGHLNKFGHRVIAEKLAKVICELEVE